MLKINPYFIQKQIIIFIAIIASTTGILKYFIGPMLAETVLLVFITILMAILLFFKKRYTFLDFLFIFIAIYSIIITLINISIGDVSHECFLGIYYFTVPCLIFLNRENSFFKRNSELYFKAFFIMLIINSLYAMYQTINLNAFIPSELGRARGLMKATLNYSGLTGAFFFPFVVLKLKHQFLKLIGFLCVCTGGILTLSRGLIANVVSGILASYPLALLIRQHISKRMIKLFIIYGIVIVLIVFGIISFLNYTDQLDSFERLFLILDYKNDPANNIRVGFYGQFVNHFLDNIFGHGVGRLVSGTTYVSNCVNFESYILGAFYSIGFIALIYFLIPICWMYTKLKNLSSSYQQVSIMFIFGLWLQNLVQAPMITPTTLVITWLNIIFFTHYLIHIDNNSKIPQKKNRKVRITV